MGEEVLEEGKLRIRKEKEWRGRVINEIGNEIEGKGEMKKGKRKMEEERIDKEDLRSERVDRGLSKGVNVIDILKKICFGKRKGILEG